MKVFSLKSCDTCKKAIKALRDAGHDPQIIDVRADGLTDADRAAIIDQFGDAVINKSSTTWRNLEEGEKAQPVASLLTLYPTLMKRPVIQNGDVWTIGWKADAQAAHL
ncbi:MAG: arsenate reductase-like glutaredoxin family protein [Loktanella salsilacus]|jgi:arsenate reductase-like glutaredoxin family protein|uniref:arsenate reductase family protein n=1 Tax=Loktanella salsilacus TaxID=195913 RepID=UPI003989B1C7